MLLVGSEYTGNSDIDDDVGIFEPDLDELLLDVRRDIVIEELDVDGRDISDSLFSLDGEALPWDGFTFLEYPEGPAMGSPLFCWS